MFDLSTLIRPHLKSLVPYATARDEFKGEARIFLDANENSFGGVLHGEYHRYPDPRQQAVKQALAALKGVSADQIFIGHGSDEAIELLIRAVCEPGQDAIVILPPTYGMYEVSAGINNVAVIRVPLRDDFSINEAELQKQITRQTKLLFICAPNNPTATLPGRDAILRIAGWFHGLVVVDEAYIDFAPEHSLIPALAAHPNLVVLQTLSKAWGLAALRVGMAFASPQLIAVLSRMKPPYNVNGPAQQLALRALQRPERMRRSVERILAERKVLTERLSMLPCVTRILDSAANFILVKTTDGRALYTHLLQQGIVVRDRSNVLLCEEGLRITVGTPLENRAVVKAFESFSGVFSSVPESDVATDRHATIERRTNETTIQVSVNLDGSGDSLIDTGLGFFDHMLQQIAKHSGIDLLVAVRGDLCVDEHHTIEDTGLALGAAFAQALGQKRGIERYGFHAPMDEARAEALLDLSGRPWLVWNIDFTREHIGDVPTEMFRHFFHSFAETARCTVHLSAAGENEHHKIECAFKAFARALRDAVRISGDSQELPSTKGTL